MNVRCEQRQGGIQCILIGHGSSIDHCFAGPEGWIFKGIERKKLREARELIVAFITQVGSMEVHADGHKTFSFFLDDAQVANVAHDDVFSVTYDFREGGNIYRVER